MSRKIWIYENAYGDLDIGESPFNVSDEDEATWQAVPMDKLKIAIDTLQTLKQDLPWGQGDVVTKEELINLTLDKLNAT